MKKLTILFIIPALCMIIVSNVNAQNSIDGKYDIAELKKTAQANFDLNSEDAVYLLDHQKVSWQPDGRLAVTIHKIIWVNSSMAVDNFGDHRIPYDDDSQDFKVITVRTWRDNQWWVTGQTGIVETLPEEMRNAFDYSNRREMMLLHNGIEIPCVLEVAYTITDKQPWRKNISGSYYFRTDVPAVTSSFEVEIPEGRKLLYSITPETSQPSLENNTENGADIYTWKQGPFDKLPYPGNNESRLLAPHITWSTWESWEYYAQALNEAYQNNTALDSSLLHDLDSMRYSARDKLELAEYIADYASQKIRYIDYDPGYWLWHPRDVSRIYGTFYGHALDFTFFTKALYQKAGLECELVFIRNGLVLKDMDIAAIDDHWHPYLLLNINPCAAFYDPASSYIIKGENEFFDQTCFYTGMNRKNHVAQITNDATDNSFNLQMELGLNDSKDSLTGKGYLYAAGCLAPYPDMTGLNNEANSCLSGIIASVIEGTEIPGMNTVVFDCDDVKIGFEFSMPLPEADDPGRIVLNIGDPSGGIISKLPNHVHLYDETRGSDIYLTSAMKQEVQIKLDTAGIELVYTPEDNSVSVDLGSFTLETKSIGKKIVITRDLSIINKIIRANEWPLLRNLLLAETHEKNQKLIFKIKDDD